MTIGDQAIPNPNTINHDISSSLLMSLMWEKYEHGAAATEKYFMLLVVVKLL